MQSPKKDIEVEQGSTLLFHFVMSEIDTKEDTEVPVNLMEAEAKMQIRRSQRSEEVLLDLNEGGFIEITDPVNGQVTVNVPPEETQKFTFSSAVYDIEIHFRDKTVIRLVEGRVINSLGVTR